MAKQTQTLEATMQRMADRVMNARLYAASPACKAGRARIAQLKREGKL